MKKLITLLNGDNVTNILIGTKLSLDWIGFEFEKM